MDIKRFTLTAPYHGCENGDRFIMANLNGNENGVYRVLSATRDTCECRTWLWHDWIALVYWKIVRFVKGLMNDANK